MKLKIKLWIDDIRPAPEGWHWVKTVTEAIRILDTTEVTDVSLDHDISVEMRCVENGEWHTVRSDETYEPVARFMEEKYSHIVESMRGEFVPNITIHTANPIGRERMLEILKDFNPTVVEYK